MSSSRDGEKSKDATAYGYRGPGTDLGEDIRRGYVRRDASEPPAHARGEGLCGDDWGERLRRGWRGLFRRRS